MFLVLNVRDLSPNEVIAQMTYMVGGVGFEPTQPEAPDLQSGAALQLCRPPISEPTISYQSFSP